MAELELLEEAAAEGLEETKPEAKEPEEPEVVAPEVVEPAAAGAAPVAAPPISESPASSSYWPASDDEEDEPKEVAVGAPAGARAEVVRGVDPKYFSRNLSHLTHKG